MYLTFPSFLLLLPAPDHGRRSPPHQPPLSQPHPADRSRRPRSHIESHRLPVSHNTLPICLSTSCPSSLPFFPPYIPSLQNIFTYPSFFFSLSFITLNFYFFSFFCVSLFVFPPIYVFLQRHTHIHSTSSCFSLSLLTLTSPSFPPHFLSPFLTFPPQIQFSPLYHFGFRFLDSSHLSSSPLYPFLFLLPHPLCPFPPLSSPHSPPVKQTTYCYLSRLCSNHPITPSPSPASLPFSLALIPS